jgi:subtilisin inhibitor-like
MSQKRIAPALLLAGAALLALGPQATAMGIPATRIDRLTVSYDDGSGQPLTYHLVCGHDQAPDDQAVQGQNAGGQAQSGQAAPGAQAQGGQAQGGQTPAAQTSAGQAATPSRTTGDRSTDGCARLDQIGGPVPAVPSGQVCSMIYGGPQTATVSGMWRGHRISEKYRRTNGCEVARWTRMVPALPAPVQHIATAPQPTG